MSHGILPSFLGALQASLAVLLTIGYGAVASRFNLLKESSSRDISKTCVRLFLPALMITNVGSELQADTIHRYVPILVWALVYTLSSMALGWLLKRVFKFPAWTVPAICFNNTTALPLLLIQSLETSGILKDFTMGKGDTSSAAASRAKSYFLAAAMIGNSLTFAIGPKLLDDEETPDECHDQQQNGGHKHANGVWESDEEHADPINGSGRTAEEQEEHVNETTTLLPDPIARRSGDIMHEVSERSEKQWVKLPLFIRECLTFSWSFLNAPLIGALVGTVIGLTPPLHRAFFNEPDQGGIFKAWLTASVKNIGELFAALQLVIVGAKLSGSLLKMKKGEASGQVKVIPMLSIFFIRFIMWPMSVHLSVILNWSREGSSIIAFMLIFQNSISITVIYFLASKTNLLDEDPILWFVMMLIPTGPSATKLTALADVSGAEEDEKMSIAKFITISYAVSPVICFAVVGSLKASLAIKQ